MGPLGIRSLEQAVAGAARSLLRPDTLPVCCERLDGESFTARFNLRLISSVAAVQPSSDLPAYDNFLIEHALATLEPGQELRFAFRRNCARDGDAQVTFEVSGQAVHANSETAEASAKALYDSLTRLLAARVDISFEPVANTDITFAHRFKVEVEGILLTTQGKPEPPNMAPMPLILPALSLVEARVPFWDALLGCSFPVEAIIALRPVRLEDEELKVAAETMRKLGDSRLRYEHFPARRPLSREQVRPLNGWFEQEIERWLRLAVGVALDVEFATQEPVSPNALRWLAQTLLPTRRLCVRHIDDMAPPIGPAVDLRNCLNEARIMPALLPGREMVGRLGLPETFPGPQTALATSGIVLGEACNRSVHLPSEDRERHCYVVGATGCGKSTLLRNLIMQDIDAGEGVCLIDPHGDLHRDILDAIPRHRAMDVVLFDLTDFDRVAGLNYLEIPGVNPAMERSFITNEMMKILDRLYDLRTVGGPMFESYARFGLLLLMENQIPGLTLVEFPLIFECEPYRKWLVRNCTNPSVVRFWSQQAERARGEGSLENMSVYVTSKFNQFTGNVLLRNIVGQSRSTIDFRSVMDERKILLVNLSKGLLGEFDSALLGMLIVSKLFVSALGRARVPRAARHPLHLYVDEFQNFTTDTVAHLLSEARKFGLRLVLANQHLAQIDVGRGAGNLSAAVLANVGTILAMRLGAADAEALKGLLGPNLTSRALQNLPDYHVAARLIQGGQPAAPFVFKTLAPEERHADPAAQLTILRSHAREFSRSATLVEREIAARAIVPRRGS